MRHQPRPWLFKSSSSSWWLSCAAAGRWVQKCETGRWGAPAATPRPSAAASGALAWWACQNGAWFGAAGVGSGAWLGGGGGERGEATDDGRVGYCIASPLSLSLLVLAARFSSFSSPLSLSLFEETQRDREREGQSFPQSVVIRDTHIFTGTSVSCKPTSRTTKTKQNQQFVTPLSVGERQRDGRERERERDKESAEKTRQARREQMSFRG